MAFCLTSGSVERDRGMSGVRTLGEAEELVLRPSQAHSLLSLCLHPQRDREKKSP